MPAYLVHRRLKFPTNPRAQRENWELRWAEVGEVAEDIPPQSREWLTARGHIEPVAAAAKRIAAERETGEEVADYEAAFLAAHGGGDDGSEDD